MATIKVPVYGSGRVEKNVYCEACHLPVRRYATFEQAMTPWNIGPNGPKSRAEIVAESKEWAEAWRTDIEICNACEPDRKKRERTPVHSEVTVYASLNRTKILYSGVADVAPVALCGLAKTAGTKAVEAGAPADSWDLMVEIRNTEISTTTYWKLSTAGISQLFAIADAASTDLRILKVG